MNKNSTDQQEMQLEADRKRPVRLDSDTSKELDAAMDMSPDHAGIDVTTTAKAGSRPLETKQRDGDAGKLSGPVGLDIGTTRIVVAQNNCKSTKTFAQLNAFFTVPYSPIMKRTLEKDAISFIDKQRQFYIFGSAAEDFATMNGAIPRRTVEAGLLNPQEEEAVDVMKDMLSTIVRKPEQDGETICFSVPGEPADGSISTVFHESVIKTHLKSLGYKPVPVNEGLSVVLSELADSNYTGIGVSIGGGMCNVCFAYLSVPVITYSIRKGGDYIDQMVADAIGESQGKIRTVKENGFDLNSEPSNRIETGLHVFYDELFDMVLKSLKRSIETSDKIPRLYQGIPIVLSGGSVAPRGCRERFERALSSCEMPVSISEVRVAEKPLFATAMGSLKMAMEEVTV
ncbi:hypothetical protein ACFL43_03735 [Thermodesulfobacteriota bacterium]